MNNYNGEDTFASLASVRDVAVKCYREYFKSDPSIGAVAPGRVNLIGEHTDYNDGFVFPMALPLVTVVVGSKTNTNKCHIITTNEFVDYPTTVIFDAPSANNSLSPGKPAWANYVKGVIAYFKGDISGFNAVISSSVPTGGGLSSSASIEVAMYAFLEALFSSPATQSRSWQDKAKICQKAEHEFAGMPCGIMDQFISFMGKKKHVALLDCRSLRFKLLPFVGENVSVLITNTNVRHELTGSEYPTRKKQCEEAAKVLGKQSLRDVTVRDLEDHKGVLQDVVYRRARHVVTEIERTVQSADALVRQDYKEFGILMQQSHQSLREDFEVSCEELDQVVNAAMECDGVYGSRMTGGGFGGCSVTLLETSAVPKVVQHIKDKYKGSPEFLVCHPADGAHIINLS